MGVGEEDRAVGDMGGELEQDSHDGGNTEKESKGSRYFDKWSPYVASKKPNTRVIPRNPQG